MAVDVWRVDLDDQHDRSVLAAGELERAGRMRDERVRSRFLASRAWLRVILAGYLDLPPAAIRYGAGARGKPSVAGGGDLSFSLSRSAGAALVAVSRHGEVGVDIERVRPDVEHAGLANRFFTPDESAALRELPDDARLTAFFELWVRKEAVSKASGAGLGDGLGHLDVRTDVVGGRWSVTALEAPPGFTAALAVEEASPAHRLLDPRTEDPLITGAARGDRCRR